MRRIIEHKRKTNLELFWLIPFFSEAEQEEPDLMINGDVEDNADEEDQIKTAVEPANEPATPQDTQTHEDDGAKVSIVNYEKKHSWTWGG